VIVGVLRWHFSDPTRIEIPDLVDRVWVANETSPIVISSLAEWNPNNSSERPAIFVDRLDQDRDLANRGIGDQLQGGKPGNFAFFVTGAHVVHCVGGREGEAEILAKEVWRELSRFGPIIRPALCLLRFMPVKIGKRVELTEHKQIYTVPVMLTYGYIEEWRVNALDESEITAINTILQTA
jgi:hypothetical protein